FSASAFGADVNTGSMLATAYRTSASTLVQTPAALSANLTTAPTPRDIGQWFDVTLTVSNSGQATATLFTVAAPVQTPVALSSTAVNSGAIPVTVAGGQTRVFTWTYSANG